jgi:competence protein ComEC
VHIVGELRERISKYEDYNALMHNRGYVGGVGVSDMQILAIDDDMVGGVRRYAIEKLGRYAVDAASHSVVEGMVVGSRHSMPSQLREQYSATGLSHILAVSGLHLGIIALVVSLLLTPLKLLTYGHILADILTVAVLWLFVVISGASPSVVRAALMFSVLILVRNSTGHYDPINALAFTIFLMLCYNPQTLYDISFQLSVLAVVGIVVWGAPIVRCLRFRSSIATALVSTFVVGTVATLWTLPVVSATFGNIPLVGVVATPVVLITAYMIVGCGVAVLLLPHPLAQPVAHCAEWFASVQNVGVEWFASLPFASLQHTLSPTAIVVYYSLFAIATLALWSRKPKTKTIPSNLSQIKI